MGQVVEKSTARSHRGKQGDQFRAMLGPQGCQDVPDRPGGQIAQQDPQTDVGRGSVRLGHAQPPTGRSEEPHLFEWARVGVSRHS
ncbi:hypothetical protein [Kibdelosporangium philippinense]|uniref:hypothetical protein n=1 Tax=Kibdelosporangium philippinense TaxID=211113 RepID=UPI00360B2D7A